MPLKITLLADRSEVGLWQMTVSPTGNGEEREGVGRNQTMLHAGA